MAYFVYFVFKVDKTDSNVAPITKVLFEHFKNVTYKGITINYCEVLQKSRYSGGKVVLVDYMAVHHGDPQINCFFTTDKLLLYNFSSKILFNFV